MSTHRLRARPSRLGRTILRSTLREAPTPTGLQRVVLDRPHLPGGPIRSARAISL